MQERRYGTQAFRNVSIRVPRLVRRNPPDVAAGILYTRFSVTIEYPIPGAKTRAPGAGCDPLSSWLLCGRATPQKARRATRIYPGLRELDEKTCDCQLFGGRTFAHSPNDVAIHAFEVEFIQLGKTARILLCRLDQESFLVLVLWTVQD